MANNQISIAKPIIGDEEINAVIDVMKSGMIAQGPKVKEFEEKFAEYVGAKYGVATNSGTAALHVAMLSAGLKPGDEVITTPFTFVATGNSVLYTGAKPVFVDIDPKTYTLDPSKIEEAITENTKAILPVQLFGQSADMKPICDIAKDNDLIVIEDAAQAHGAKYNGDEKVGSIGDMGCFSFYPTKNMTTSEGGMITTDNEELAKKSRIYRAHGSSVKYKHDVIGYNFRMTDIGAAIGLEQLKKIDSFNEKRINNAKYLTEGLKDLKGITTPFVREGSKHVFHQYTIRVSAQKRDEWVEFFNENGIGNGIHYPIPLYEQPLYEKLGYKQDLPVTKEIASTVISIPVHPSLTTQDLDTIIKVVREGSQKFE
ncbi:DegT/DnrJ/EryC1/StrS family aminotransferase [Methanobrevibacter acididurans]|uniref:DegT/DnrJ/EryC1/StrS family aminotransferase n=1 Tax=Methanobrevibacter acididurans TaxID=120963 RepID=UPI0038FC0AEF